MENGYVGMKMVGDASKSQTEIERLYERFANPSRRLGDMLDALETKIDRVMSAPTTLNQVNVRDPSPAPPPHMPGTIAALDQLAENLRERADKLDQQLCRLGTII